MILEQAERDRVQQLLCETLPAICQASLSGFADIKVDALIGITLNKSDVFLVSIKETCHPDGAVDIDEGKGGRPSKVNKIIAKTEVSTKRTSGRGRRKKAKRAASESEEEYIPSKKASQRGENDELDTSTTAAEQSEGSPRKRSRAQRKSAVKAEASFQEQEPDDDEAPELPPHGTAEFSDDDFVGDDTGDYSDMDNDDETEMTDIRQQIDNQQASLDKMMIKQEPDSTDRTSTADGDGDFLDRPFTASKASDDQMENTDEQDTSSNKQCLDGSSNQAYEGRTTANTSTQDTSNLLEENSFLDGMSNIHKIKIDLVSSDGKKKPKRPFFKCSQCEFTSIYASAYSRHKLIHSGAHLRCPHCPVKMRSKSELQKHIDLHTSPLKCKLCQREFRSVTGLKYHINTFHLNQFKFSCEICGKGLRSKAAYGGHMSQHHNAPKQYKCPLCHSEFDYANSLQRHVQRCGVKHKIMEAEEYPCEQCGVKFKKHYYLKAHMKGAHSNRILYCDCGKSFKWHASLYNHKRYCAVVAPK